MSAAPQTAAAARSILARALAETLADHSHRSLGDVLGVAGTTIDRRGADLHAWPLSEAVDLAWHDSTLREAFRAVFVEAPASGSALAAPSDLRDLCAEAAGSIQAVLLALKDGRIIAAEATHILNRVCSMERSIRKAKADLKALLEASR
jgi:hypothetical protein